MTGLGDFPGGQLASSAIGVSDDGAVVVGNATPSTLDGEAFRWTSDAGMVGLGVLAGGTSFSTANRASADGAVVVGRSSSAAGLEAFRWTSATGMVSLGDLSGGQVSSEALGVSADGDVIVGIGTGDVVREAFVWEESQGMRRLFEVLVANGVTNLDGWTLSAAWDVSADGRWVVGYGVNPDGYTEGFLADITPVPVPTAAWLFVSALGLLGWLRGRP
jgi:probable HAF family extracellular repeat protein